MANVRTAPLVLDEAAVRRMNAGRKTIEHRTFLHQRRHRVAQRNQRRAENDRRIARLHLIGQLHRDLRARLIVVEHELQRLAMNAAIRVRRLLELQKRLLLGLAEERAAASERQDDIDFAIRGLRHRNTAEKRGGNKKSANAQSILRIFWRLGALAFRAL